MHVYGAGVHTFTGWILERPCSIKLTLTARARQTSEDVPLIAPINDKRASPHPIGKEKNLSIFWWLQWLTRFTYGMCTDTNVHMAAALS